MILVLIIKINGHVIQSLSLITRGINQIITGENFSKKINYHHKDEFGVIVNGVNGLVNVASQILEAQELLSLHDPLTNVLNRRGFDREFEEYMIANQTHRLPLSILIIDIDHFKSVNDTFGHTAGDSVLILLAKCLQEQVRADDIVSRFGGEEFVILLSDCRVNQAAQIAEKIRMAIEQTHFEIERKITVSIGAVEWKEGQTSSYVIGLADNALYESKENGRNRVSVSINN